MKIDDIIVIKIYLTSRMASVKWRVIYVLDSMYGPDYCEEQFEEFTTPIEFMSAKDIEFELITMGGHIMSDGYYNGYIRFWGEDKKGIFEWIESIKLIEFLSQGE